MIGCVEALNMPDGLYIDGEFVQVRGAAREEIINPATEEPIGAVQIAGLGEAQEAIRAARAAFDAARGRISRRASASPTSSACTRHLRCGRRRSAILSSRRRARSSPARAPGSSTFR